MTEFRAKKMQKITARIQGLIEELELLIDAELRHVDEYGACEDLCRSMSDADQLMRRAVYKMQEAAAFASAGGHAGRHAAEPGPPEGIGGERSAKGETGIPGQLRSTA